MAKAFLISISQILNRFSIFGVADSDPRFKNSESESAAPIATPKNISTLTGSKNPIILNDEVRCNFIHPLVFC